MMMDSYNSHSLPPLSRNNLLAGSGTFFKSQFCSEAKSNFKSAREVSRRVIQSARVGHVWESKVELTDAGL
jgi:hypothetical protein